jgi:hypothetical protein
VAAAVRVEGEVVVPGGNGLAHRGDLRTCHALHDTVWFFAYSVVTISLDRPDFKRPMGYRYT